MENTSENAAYDANIRDATNDGRARKRRDSVPHHPRSGVVLSLADAAAIHRMLEFLMDDRRFYNPIEAFEARTAAAEAKDRLAVKLITQFQR